MRILTIDCDYESDTSAPASALRAVIEQQAVRAHTITVFTTQGDRDVGVQSSLKGRENAARVRARRIRMLRETSGRYASGLINHAWFCLRVLIHALANRYDLVIAANHPYPLMGLVLRAVRALRSVPYIYICNDLYPESAIFNGEIRHGRRYDWLLRLDSAACSAAQFTVVPSTEMARSLAARDVPRERIAVIRHAPRVSSPVVQSAAPPTWTDAAGTVQFLFVGALCRHQGLERLIAAARLVAARVPFRLVFIGDGNAKGELIDLAGDLLGRRIKFTNHQSIEAAIEAMRVCDYGIVSLAVDADHVTFPAESVLYGWVGRPVIALLEPQCELSRMIEQQDWGYVAASRSVTGIAEVIVKAVVERDRWTPQRRRQLEASCRAVFDPMAAHAAWDCMIAGHAPEPAVAPRPVRISNAA